MPKISIQELQRTLLIDIDRISWFEADGNNTRLTLSDGTKILSTKILKYFSERLHEKGFHRIHAKYLVNLAHIYSYSRGKSITVKMLCQTGLPVSARKKSGFLKSVP